MHVGGIHVHGVEDKPTLRRFRELPFVLHHEDDRWVPPVRAFDEWRLDARRHPYFDAGDAAYYVARRGGTVVGRIAAHVPHVGQSRPEGRFGFFDAIDDDHVVDALVAAAATWLREQGAVSMTGPLGWNADEEVGILAAGFEHAGTTAVPWHPPWYVEQLRRCRLEVCDSIERWEVSTLPGTAPPPTAEPPPAVAASYGDPRLVIDGVRGVPDLGRTLVGTGLRGAWRTARRAKDRAWDRAVITSIDGDPSEAVHRFRCAAGAAGYTTVLAPEGSGPPRTSHAVLVRDI